MFAISVEKADSFILLALRSMFAISVEADSFIFLALLKGTIKAGLHLFPDAINAAGLVAGLMMKSPAHTRRSGCRCYRQLSNRRGHGIHENPEQDLIT